MLQEAIQKASNEQRNKEYSIFLAETVAVAAAFGLGWSYRKGLSAAKISLFSVAHLAIQGSIAAFVKRPRTARKDLQKEIKQNKARQIDISLIRKQDVEYLVSIFKAKEPDTELQMDRTQLELCGENAQKIFETAKEKSQQAHTDRAEFYNDNIPLFPLTWETAIRGFPLVGAALPFAMAGLGRLIQGYASWQSMMVVLANSVGSLAIIPCWEMERLDQVTDRYFA